jgi:hypothetical protein
MLDAKQRAEFDQSVAQFAELFPAVCWQAFERLKVEGFSEVQAMEIVKTYVLATFGKVHP